MKIGDHVCRKKYGKDICFEIVDIKDDIYYLRGIEYRLVADSDESDLEIKESNELHEDIQLDNPRCLKGSVLHIDGDPYYLKMCLNKYHEYGIRVIGYYYKEEEIKDHIIPLLEKHKPDLLVITGHDALKKDSNQKESHNYLHSQDYVQAIMKAREYEDDKDALIIFAGACQSYYELLLAAGANFASSPARKNIHALDPVVVICQIANASVKEYVDLEKIIDKTSHKQLGIGGIDTRGVARNLYPR